MVRTPDLPLQLEPASLARHQIEQHSGYGALALLDEPHLEALVELASALMRRAQACEPEVARPIDRPGEHRAGQWEAERTGDSGSAVARRDQCRGHEHP